MFKLHLEVGFSAGDLVGLSSWSINRVPVVLTGLYCPQVYSNGWHMDWMLGWLQINVLFWSIYFLALSMLVKTQVILAMVNFTGSTILAHMISYLWFMFRCVSISIILLDVPWQGWINPFLPPENNYVLSQGRVSLSWVVNTSHYLPSLGNSFQFSENAACTPKRKIWGLKK